MNSNFYDDLIVQIQEAIIANDLNKAESLIDEELSMPYSPRNVIGQLNKFKQEISSLRNPELVNTTILSEDQLQQAFESTQEKMLEAINSLRMSNCRNYLTIIKEALVNENLDYYLRVLVLEILVEQSLNETILFSKTGTLLKINPSTLPKVMLQENVGDIFKKIDKLTKKNPSFQKQCEVVTTYLLYSIYPDLVSKQEIDNVVYSVIRYVYKAYNQPEQWEEFAQVYGIDEDNLFEILF